MSTEPSAFASGGGSGDPIGAAALRRHRLERDGDLGGKQDFTGCLHVRFSFWVSVAPAASAGHPFGTPKDKHGTRLSMADPYRSIRKKPSDWLS